MFFDRPGQKRDEKSTRLPFTLGMVGLGLILGMTAIIAFFPFHYKVLDAEVRKAEGRFYITNNTDNDWSDVRLLLNSDYKLSTPVLLAHSVFSPELTEFKKDDGTKFGIYYQVNDLYITAVTPGKQTISNIYKFSE